MVSLFKSKNAANAAKPSTANDRQGAAQSPQSRQMQHTAANAASPAHAAERRVPALSPQEATAQAAAAQDAARVLPSGQSSGSLSADSRGALIEIRSVGKIFDAFDGGKTEALRQTSLTINPGEFVALVGPSGCGKSTLLRIVSGLETATSGSVLIDGQLVNGTNPHVGFVFQDPNLFPWLSVRNNIGFGPGLKTGRRHLPHEVDDLIRRVGLESFANALPHHLSGGMAQRAALARALVNQPSLLLLDEPLGALDAFTRMAMQDELRSLMKTRGTTALLVTHDIDEALYLSDRVLIMAPRPGRIEGEITLGPNFPRVRNAPEFNEYRGQILETLHFAPTTPEDYGPNI